METHTGPLVESVSEEEEGDVPGIPLAHLPAGYLRDPF
jgi:hypothetical protein